MILDELVLHNVGVFKGRQALALTPPSPTKPVVVIGGLNGGGKTTILDAIQLALYGALARTAGRRGTAYDTYLRQAIHRHVEPRDGAAVELAFHAFHEGLRHDYRIHRSWRSTGSGVRERLEVTRDGRLDARLTESWLDHVEAFVPRGVAALFFFDGEQIEAFADLENSRALLGTAIGALLGLDLVDRLGADMLALERRNRMRAAPEEARVEIEQLRCRVGELRRNEEQATQTVASVRVRTERAEKRVFEAQEAYRLEGGELFEQRGALEERLAGVRRELTALDNELRELAAGAGPLLLVRDQLTTIEAGANSELYAAQDQALAGVLAERDAAVLSTLRVAKASRSAISAIERMLAADRAQRATAAGAEPVLGLDREGAALAAGLVNVVLPDLTIRLRTLLDRRAAVTGEIEQVERSLAGVPDDDALAAAATRHRDAVAELAVAQAALAQADGELAAARVERTRAEAAYERAIEETARATLAAEDDRRLLEHARRVRATLDGFRVEAIRRHVGRIEQLVLDALRQLLRKERLIAELTIDPETYAIELRGASGEILPAGQLSAGERQLLAVALLWGLARAAGQPLPVVIDTPLGRLDGSHRGHLVERYFPRASHQVILLSTDKEIDEQAWRQLRPRVGRMYRLDFDDVTSSTTIRPGYFW